MRNQKENGLPDMEEFQCRSLLVFQDGNKERECIRLARLGSMPTLFRFPITGLPVPDGLNRLLIEFQIPARTSGQ